MLEQEAADYRAVNENPCHMCMPLGAILPFKGVERAMVLIHGSQGCSTYMRRHLAEHFHEPIDVASSALNEQGTIYGGEASLKKGLDNLVKLYQPGVIGILTTCLAETIGEDTARVAADYLREKRPPGLHLITVSTPGYGGTHSEGYFLALRRIVVSLTGRSEKHPAINIIAPHLSPADLREIKRILELWQVDYILLPDFSETLDGPLARPYKKIPPGGTRVRDIARMGGARATIQLGLTVDDAISPGCYLAEECGVPLYKLPVPTGLANTDLFMELLGQLTGRPLPASLARERGRLLDCMIDAHKHNAQGRAVIFGEPEIVYAVTSFCLENGIEPVVVATGSNDHRLPGLLKNRLEETGASPCFLREADFQRIREKSREREANIAIGHSDGRYLTEKEGIPLVRHGFPIHDRVGGQRLLSVGYAGSIMFLDRITNTLLESKHQNYRLRLYQAFYRPAGPDSRQEEG
ncbi:nitrogenase component 1 [Desulfurispora thermophila]|uniref:nitrogenase component 1 n=1 Tax=Desulfurispora thermophila TaxID=265470 RepID=UPI0003793427|nr:nitrogenase component 1 [Desulfurispora thermophila]